MTHTVGGGSVQNNDAWLALLKWSLQYQDNTRDVPPRALSVEGRYTTTLDMLKSVILIHTSVW